MTLAANEKAFLEENYSDDISSVHQEEAQTEEDVAEEKCFTDPGVVNPKVEIRMKCCAGNTSDRNGSQKQASTTSQPQNSTNRSKATTRTNVVPNTSGNASGGDGGDDRKNWKGKPSAHYDDYVDLDADEGLEEEEENAPGENKRVGLAQTNARTFGELDATRDRVDSPLDTPTGKREVDGSADECQVQRRSSDQREENVQSGPTSPEQGRGGTSSQGQTPLVGVPFEASENLNAILIGKRHPTNSPENAAISNFEANTGGTVKDQNGDQNVQSEPTSLGQERSGTSLHGTISIVGCPAGASGDLNEIVICNGHVDGISPEISASTNHVANTGEAAEDRDDDQNENLQDILRITDAGATSETLDCGRWRLQNTDMGSGTSAFSGITMTSPLDQNTTQGSIRPPPSLTSGNLARVDPRTSPDISEIDGVQPSDSFRTNSEQFNNEEACGSSDIQGVTQLIPGRNTNTASLSVSPPTDLPSDEFQMVPRDALAGDKRDATPSTSTDGNHRPLPSSRTDSNDVQRSNETVSLPVQVQDNDVASAVLYVNTAPSRPTVLTPFEIRSQEFTTPTRTVPDRVEPLQDPHASNDDNRLARERCVQCRQPIGDDHICPAIDYESQRAQGAARWNGPRAFYADPDHQIDYEFLL